MKTIAIRCKGSGLALIDTLMPFQGDLKDLSEQSYKQLKKGILKLGFIQPISVWDHEGVLNILDGHQRLRVLQRMQKDGYEIPLIPIISVEADNLKEAKEKVLALTSQFGNITDQGLYQFMNEAGLEFQEIKASFRFPEVDLQKFEANFFGTEEEETKADELIDLSQQWIVSVHCTDEQDMKTVFEEMSERGFECKLIT